MGHDNIIELNGKRYDALTGKYLGKSHSKPVPAAPPKAGLTIDGVRRPASQHKPASKPTHHAKKEPDHKSEHHKPHDHPPAKPNKKPTHRKKAHHAKPHTQQRSKTLMRSSVKKPDIQAHTQKQIAQKPANNLEFKKAAHAVNTERLERSRQVSRHQHVDRFARTSFSRQQIEAPKRPQPVHAQPVHRAEQQHLKPADVFESAISRANSHEQPQHKIKPSRKRRALTIVSAAAVLLIAVGAIAWMQKSTIELKVASFQAGFQASQPGYNLTDYQKVSTRYEHGQVAITYQSGNRHYEITQQESDWNSQTLLDSAVAAASTEEPQVIESKGRIVYLYEGNNASWVDGGIRYDITGNANLTRKDIKAIVDSM